MRPSGSIISQILVAFSAFALLIAVAAVVGYAGLARQNSATKQLTGQDYVLQQAAGRMQQDFTTSQLSISSFALSGRPGAARPIGASRADFAAQLAILQRAAPPSLSGLITTQARSGAQLFTVADTIGKLPPASAQAATLAAGTTRIAAEFLRGELRLQERLAVSIRQLTAESKHALGAGLAWSAAAIAVAVALILLVSVAAVRGITGPLRRLTVTMRRLTSGEHAARARLAGAAEVREVAESVNAMADENDRLRAQEEEHARLRALAREAGNRIGRHISAEDVLREASTAITQCVDSDLAVLRLLDDDQPRYADCARKDWLPVNFITEPTPDFDEWARGCSRSSPAR